MLNTDSNTDSTQAKEHWPKGTSHHNWRNRNSNGLTLQQQKFVDAYLADPRRNATKAYRKAYGNAADSTCMTNGNRLLRHAQILKVVDETERKQRIKAAKKLDLSHEQWLLSIAACVYADPRQLIDSAGKFVHPHEIPAHLAPAIEQIEVFQSEGKVTGWRYKLANKRQSQELLGKAMHWLEQTGVNLNVSAPRFNFNIGHTVPETKVIDVTPDSEAGNASNSR
jgi:phage terminase small subunit